MPEIWIRFDGPPSHDAGRFIETEDAEGRGVGGFEWRDNGDGTWSLGPFARVSGEANDGGADEASRSDSPHTVNVEANDGE
jgi:hypothetical protein